MPRKIGERVACSSSLIRSSRKNSPDFCLRKHVSEWPEAWPTGVILGYTKDQKCYYVLANSSIYEFEIKECWYLEKVDLNYDELLTHSNELVRTLTKEIVKGMDNA